MTTLYVTAFKDIGRGDWEYFTASTETYVDHFLRMTQVCPRIVCFVEPEMMRVLKDKVPETCMLLDYDAANTFFKYEPIEKHIMASGKYKKTLQHRLHHPEHCKPTYNLVNHNKVLFIQRALRLFPSSDFYAWVDFHYSRHLDIQFNSFYGHLPIHQITIASFRNKSALTEIKTCWQLAIESEDIIQGSTFFVPRAVVNILCYEYEQQVIANYKEGIADDDQNIHLAILFRRPELYNLVVSAEWGKMFSLIAKSVR